MRSQFAIAVTVAVVVLAVIGFGSVAFADEAAHRTILKIGGLVGAVLGLIGISVAGYFAGKDFGSYTGWERYTHGSGMFFNRKPFRKDKPRKYRCGRY